MKITVRNSLIGMAVGIAVGGILTASCGTKLGTSQKIALVVILGLISAGVVCSQDSSERYLTDDEQDHAEKDSCTTCG